MYRDAYKQIYRGRRGRDIVSASSFTITSTSTLYNAPSIVTTMHRREHTIYLQLINKKLFEKKITYLHIYKIENCFA
jgi:hypothetical protein